MSDEKPVIVAKNVTKDFHLPHHINNSFKHAVIGAFSKKDKRVDVHHALKGVSFEVKKGEFFGILGRNGSGKSTMLKILANIYQPKSGSVSHRGRLVSFIELGVGFKPELTGRENVYLNGALLGFSRKQIDARYDEIVSFSELEKFMDQKLKNYSSGMRVRLAFSVAIHAEADILLLDEVLAVGDAAFQRKCYDYFKSLKRNEKTVVFVTHSMGAVREYCNRAILIEDGKVAFEGAADEAADAYLRLFNPPKKTEASQPPKNRWGSGEVQFEKVSSDITKNKLTVDCTVKNGNADLSDLVIGLDIYDDDDRLVSSIANSVSNHHKFNLVAGETKSFRYVFDNILGSGEYSATLAIKSQDESSIYDNWKQAIKFTSPEQAEGGSPVILPVEITEK